MANAANNSEPTWFVSGEPFPDRPGTDPDRDDQLGRSSFARDLADAIVRITPTEGLVIGLFGSWGSGKSTVLNFVGTYLSRIQGSGVPTVIRFNPWWFSGQEDLLRAFFDQVLAQLSKSYSIAKKTGKPLRALKLLLDLFVGATAKSPGGMSVCSRLSLAIYFRWHRLTKPTFSDLRERVERELAAASSKILVVIDDIDRLTISEVRQVFRVVKAVADFPNITYLLAFDREAVCRMIEPMQGGTGEEYLAKIVQIPFELPTPDRAALHQMLFKRLDAILASTPEELFDKSRWQEVFTEGLSSLLTTPRDVVRLANALGLSYGRVREEVDSVDFVTIEAVRIFLPQVYDVIRRNRDMFCEPSWLSRPEAAVMKGAELRKFHDAWLNEVFTEGQEGRREPIRRILALLFPRLRTIWQDSFHLRIASELNASKRRICDFDVFPLYFGLSLPETSISRSEVLALFVLDGAALANRFISLCGEKRSDGLSRARALLEVLPDFIQTLSEPQAATLTTALLSAGDDLMRADRLRGHFFPPQSWLFANAARGSLQKLPRCRRAAILTTAFKEDEAVVAASWLVEVLGREHGKYGTRPEADGSPTISEAEVDELQQQVLAKIRAAADSGQLVKASPILNLLANWKRWGSGNEVADWILGVSRQPRALAQLLEGALGEATINDQVVLRLDPQWFKDLIDPSLLIAPIQKLAAEPWLSETQRIAAESFVQAYDTGTRTDRRRNGGVP